MKKRFAQTISLILAVCTLMGCRLPFDDINLTEGERKYPEFLTIDVFDIQSNTQGLQIGWFAKAVKDKFNMQLNIIAPNKEGNGDATYESMRASGKLGDIIISNAGDGMLRELVREGLILDMSDYISTCDNLMKNIEQIEVTSSYADAEGIWAIPSEISDKPNTRPADYDEPTNAPSVRWDLYRQAGYPEVGTIEDLLPVLLKMQEIAGTSDSGNPVYAFSLFKDWDGGAMQNAGALASLYGYDTLGFVMMNPETGQMQSIADEDSIYFRMLRFLFEANQMGLVDPDSPTQSYEKVAEKYKDGAVLYSFWPWMGTSLYNSEERLSEGKGFASLKIEDASYLTWGNDPNGKQGFSLMIGSSTKDPQRMVDFANWLYSQDGTEKCGSPTGDFRGPEGLTWEMTDDGPKLTEFGVQAFIDMKQDLEVPDEYGGGLWSSGVSWLNFKPVDKQEVDDNGVPYYYTMWDDYKKYTKTKLYSDWATFYKTDLEPIEYFENENMLTIIPGTEWAGYEYPSYIETIEESSRQIIVDYSWRMVFSSSIADFEYLKKTMIETLGRIGYDEVIEKNMEAAQSRYELFKSALEVEE